MPAPLVERRIGSAPVQSRVFYALRRYPRGMDARQDRVSSAAQTSMSNGGYPTASVAIDQAVVAVEDGRPLVLLWRRVNEPYLGYWGLPGVFMDPRTDDGLEAAAVRGLRNKGGLESVSHLEQLFTWDRPNRDPRGWVIVVAYFALVPAGVLRSVVREHSDLCAARVDLRAADHSDRLVLRDAANRVIETAFDHAEILRFVFKRIQGKLAYTDLALHLLPEMFTLRSLQQVYETLLGRKLNKDSFRRTVTSSGLVEPTNRYEQSVDHRPAALYRRGRTQHLQSR